MRPLVETLKGRAETRVAFLALEGPLVATAELSSETVREKTPLQSFDLRLRVKRVCAWTSHGQRHGPKGRPYPCRHIMAPPQWSCQAPRNARRDLRPGGLRPPEWGAPPLPGTLLPGRLATLSESPDSAAPCPASITATENINPCRQPIEVTWDRLGAILSRLGAILDNLGGHLGGHLEPSCGRLGIRLRAWRRPTPGGIPPPKTT